MFKPPRHDATCHNAAGQIRRHDQGSRVGSNGGEHLRAVPSTLRKSEKSIPSFSKVSVAVHLKIAAIHLAISNSSENLPASGARERKRRGNGTARPTILTISRSSRSKLPSAVSPTPNEQGDQSPSRTRTSAQHRPENMVPKGRADAVVSGRKSVMDLVMLEQW